MKKIVTIIAVVLTMIFVFSACNNSSSSNGMKFDGVKNGDGYSFKGLDWLASQDEVTKYFNLDTSKQIEKLYDGEEANTKKQKNIFIEQYFPELDKKGVVTFSYLQKSDKSSDFVKTILGDKEEGLYSINIEFCFDSDEEMDTFRKESFTKLMKNLAENNSSMKKVQENADLNKGNYSPAGQEIEINGAKVREGFFVSASDESYVGKHENLQFGNNMTSKNCLTFGFVISKDIMGW